jgi:glycosyltransferase involved in cell wall biosynthesis
MTSEPVAPSEGPVRVSVIVPVRNRADLLGALLAALDDQTFRHFEVIVIDDGSTDGADRLAESTVVAGRPVRVLRSRGGAVAARSVGTQAALGAVLAFTDSDCVPEPGWLARGVAAIDAGADLVNGLTIPGRPPNPLERTMASGLEGLYPTANMFYRRDTLVKAGGFDQAAGGRLGFRHDDLARGTGFGEDTMVAWQAIRMGARAVYEPDALVRHHVFPPSLEECLRRAWQTAAFPALIAEVPELRPTMLHHRVLFGNRSRVPFYATTAALLGRRPRLAVLGGFWWAAERIRTMRPMPDPWPSKLARLPAEMLVDGVAGVAMVVGSIRARTVAL